MKSIDSLLAEVAALEAREERLRMGIVNAVSDLIHFAQTVHQAHHSDRDGTWLTCDRGVCAGVKRALARAQETLKDDR